MCAMLADIQSVKRMLSASGEAFDVDADLRLAAINEAVSAVIESRLGRGFGESDAATVRLYEADADGYVLLTRPIRSITGIVVGGAWNGTAFAPATALTADQWFLDRTDHVGRSYRLRLAYGSVPVAVTGVWSDTDTSTMVPPDVVYAVNYLVAEQYKQEQAGPAGFRGPDGSVVRPANPWKHPLVEQALSFHGARDETEVTL